MDGLRIVHISDLHLGAAPGQGGGVIPGATRHDESAMRALDVALADVVRTSASRYDLVLVVSGDVSARGASQEVDFYLDLRDRGVRLDPYYATRALRARIATLIDIPGNHDYWGGLVLNPTLNRGVRGRFNLATVSADTLPGYLILIHSICSTYGANLAEQVLAMGAFDALEEGSLRTALRAAANSARASGLYPVQILVTHHSPACAIGKANGYTGQGHATLSSLCVQGAVVGLLTGHTHAFHRGRASTSPLPMPPEVRCGTTLQAALPYWKRHTLNFVVHELRLSDAGRLRWTASPWYYTRSRFLADTPQTVL